MSAPTTSRRTFLRLAGGGGAAVVLSAAAGTSVRAAPAAAGTSVGGSRTRVYVLVTDYKNWRNVFSDVLTVSVKEGTAEDAKVRFKSRALEHTVTVQFDNVPDQLIRFVGIDGPPGGKARGEYLLTPIGDGSRTLVTARLFMDVDGPAALFVREKRLREMRRAKLSADLRDAAAELRRLKPQA